MLLATLLCATSQSLQFVSLALARSVSPDARYLLRLCEVADGKHNVRKDGNPNSIGSDVWNWP